MDVFDEYYELDEQGIQTNLQNTGKYVIFHADLSAIFYNGKTSTSALLL